MIRTRILALSIASLVLSSSVGLAQDLSRYRQFEIGMSVSAVAHQARITSQARVLYARPGLIQELRWRPLTGLGPAPLENSAREIVFSFYNDQLFRIAVSYLWDKTEGLTVQDMVDVLSVTYGAATLAVAEITPPPFKVFSESDKIVARWEDTEYALNLLRPSYASTFGLVLFSKRLDGLAQSASSEAIRLDEQEAPRRAIERQQKQKDEDDAKQERARTANKATFQP
jgi:hypothetical protein